MICPQCGTRNQLGRHRCLACGHPFTRAAVRGTAGHQPAGQPVQTEPPVQTAPPQRAGYARATPRKRRGAFGCFLIGMTTVGVLAVLVVGGLILNDRLVQPMIVDRVGSELDREIRSAIEERTGRQPETVEPTTTTGADQPSTNPDTATTEVTITEAAINERLANSGDLGPVDQATVNVAPDGVRVNLEAYGISGTYRTDLRAENGRVVLEDGSLDGPLGYVVPAGEVEQSANNAISSTLNDYGYQVEGVRLGEDAIALAVRE